MLLRKSTATGGVSPADLGSAVDIAKGAALVGFKQRDDSGAFVTGASATQVARVLSETMSVERMGAVGDGATDDTPAFNRALAALPNGGTITLNSPAYAIGAPLTGTAKNITFVGRRGQPVLKKRADGGYGSFLHSDLGTYAGWRFENVAFDGNRAACLAASLGGYTLHLNGSKDMEFRRCLFRETHNVYAAGCRHLLFADCDWLGTRPGIMAAGAQDPAAVPTAAYGEAVILGSSNLDIHFDRCRLQFVQAGINGYADDTARSRGLHLTNCSFRNDWWATPFITYKFTPTAYNATTRVLTAAGADFTGKFGANEIMSVPIPVSSGTSFASIVVGNVNATGTQFANAQIGDVIETADGRRAEVISKVSSSSVYVRGWESIDTFEPTDQPANGTAWRLTRFYASMGTYQSATTIFLWCDPVNPFTGQHLFESGQTAVGVVCRQLAKTFYSGVHINGGQEDLLVAHCHFRGSWADQCSLFRCLAPTVTGCFFELGEDEGITCTESLRSVLSLNTFENCGTNAIFIGACHNSSILGNTIRNWAFTNPFVRGAIDGSARNLAVIGNTVDVDPTPGLGGASAYLIGLHDGDATGTVIAGNIDGGARTASLYVDNVAAPAAHAITARDLKTIDGNGAGNVDWSTGGGGGLATDGDISYDTTFHTLILGAGIAGGRLSLKALNDGDALISLYDRLGNVRSQFSDNGSFGLNSQPATGTNVYRNAPIFSVSSARWNGTASVFEPFSFAHIRLDEGAGRGVFTIQDVDAATTLAIAGRGGQVAVGFGSPAQVWLSTLGQLHVRSLLDTTPGMTVQRKSAAQSAPILAALDENSAVLSKFNRNGYITTLKTAAPSDAELATGELAWWFDQTNGAAKAMFKGKTANGTVVSASVNLT